MNQTLFIQLLQKLDRQFLMALLEGDSLCLQDDEQLVLCDVSAANRLEFDIPSAIDQPEQLRELLITEGALLVQLYYRTHPLSRSGFDRQVSELFDQYGAVAFAGSFSKRSAVTLFVDEGEVIAEQEGSARHPYGAFCELDKPLEDEQAIERVLQWLQNGEAYEQYLSMNVCRYNC